MLFLILLIVLRNETESYFEEMLWRVTQFIEWQHFKLFPSQTFPPIELLSIRVTQIDVSTLYLKHPSVDSESRKRKTKLVQLISEP